MSGEHAYRLSAAGIDVFPRLADPVDPAAYPLPTERISSGIPALDAMLTDGYWPGRLPWSPAPRAPARPSWACTLSSAGPAAASRASSPPCRRTRPSLRGSPKAWLVAGRGWDRAVPLPVDLYIDQWVHELLAAIERTGARRVLIDSLGDLAFAAGDEARYREYLYSLVQRCSRLGVSLLMTYELPELFQLIRLSEVGVSHVSDNVVVLQYLRHSSEVKRTLTVLKTRASLHQPQVREYTISPEGDHPPSPRCISPSPTRPPAQASATRQRHWPPVRPRGLPYVSRRQAFLVTRGWPPPAIIPVAD